ncbi:hypothetical protein DPMN_187132 [Dreissena polymorpha]|uniref:Uncharacterized protein n=1 Tax=Dreissena polymorpha TaxID=45954 RepID=A0A9D4DNH2_DREPO|nr:hypothetical protein DPMN_187132 [Dreissena polymorpha]
MKACKRLRQLEYHTCQMSRSRQWKLDAEDFHHSRCGRCLEHWALKEESGRLQSTPWARQLNEHQVGSGEDAANQIGSHRRQGSDWPSLPAPPP